jgi:hypothetical protein
LQIRTFVSRWCRSIESLVRALRVEVCVSRAGMYATFGAIRTELKRSQPMSEEDLEDDVVDWPMRVGAERGWVW